MNSFVLSLSTHTHNGIGSLRLFILERVNCTANKQIIKGKKGMHRPLVLLLPISFFSIDRRNLTRSRTHLWSYQRINQSAVLLSKCQVLNCRRIKRANIFHLNYVRPSTFAIQWTFYVFHLSYLSKGCRMSQAHFSSSDFTSIRWNDVCSLE